MKTIRAIVVASAFLSLVGTGLVGCAAPAPEDEAGDSREAVVGVTSESRAAIMNALRAELAPGMGGQAIVFDASQGHFKAEGDWAFLMAHIVLRDGGEPVTRGTEYEALAKEGLFDGFRVEALFQNVGGTWKVVEHGVGSTDVWWDGLWTAYPAAPRGIFPSLSAPVVTASERQAIMGGLRAVVKPELANQDILFDVSKGHFQARDGWCFLRGNIQLRDGKAPSTKGTSYEDEAKEGLFDGFHVEALLKLEGTTWKVLEHGVGSTDVWWDGLASKYPGAPSSIWDAMAYKPE